MDRRRINAIQAARALRRRAATVRAADAASREVQRLTDRVWRDVLRAALAGGPAHARFAALRAALAPLHRLGPDLSVFLLAAHAAAYRETAADLVPATRAVTREGLLDLASKLFGRFRGTNLFRPPVPEPVKVVRAVRSAGGHLPAPELTKLLWPEPTADDVRRLVYATGWQNRLASQTALATPAQLAPLVTRSALAGESPRQLAERLLPVVNGVRATANRVARTELLRVTQAGAYAAYERLGDNVLGYQVHAVLDERTRPAHRVRAGDKFYKRPELGQRGMALCPHPPVEPDGTLAFNCRCFLSPLLARADQFGPRFDPLEAAAWFDSADDRTRETVVGSERFGLLSELLGRKLRWGDFLDAGGELMSRGELVERYRWAVRV